MSSLPYVARRDTLRRDAMSGCTSTPGRLRRHRHRRCRHRHVADSIATAATWQSWTNFALLGSTRRAAVCQHALISIETYAKVKSPAICVAHSASYSFLSSHVPSLIWKLVRNSNSNAAATPTTWATPTTAATKTSTATTTATKPSGVMRARECYCLLKRVSERGSGEERDRGRVSESNATWSPHWLTYDENNCGYRDWRSRHRRHRRRQLRL